MIETQCDIVGPQGSNLFAFTTPERLAAEGPLAPVWITGKGETIALCPADWLHASDSVRISS